MLALPSVVPFDLAVPLQVFGYPRPDLGRQRYVTTLCGRRRGRVPTALGFPIVVFHGLEGLTRADTIIVPGIEQTAMPIPGDVCQALARAHARGVRIASICTGAFVLAAAGLLRGQRATTHWLDAPELQSRYPEVEVDASVLYVDGGTLLTSAGLAAGIDLCLHIVRCDHGARVANAVARRLVVPAHRSGGQAQFIPSAIPTAEDTSLEPTRGWVQSRLHLRVTVPEMARHANMSVRTFTRRFQATYGASPLNWLLRQRVLAAQEMLEGTDRSVEEIAAHCGFASAVALRAHFRRDLRTSPMLYRRSFRATTAADG